MNEHIEDAAAERDRLWTTFLAIWEAEAGAPAPPEVMPLIADALPQAGPLLIPDNYAHWLPAEQRWQLAELNEGARLLASGDYEGYARWWEARDGTDDG